METWSVAVVLPFTLLVSILLGALALWRLCRCRHAWELVDKTEFPPPLKDVEEAGRGALLWMSDIARLSYRVVVLALRCTKCGAARIVKETNKV